MDTLALAGSRWRLHVLGGPSPQNDNASDLQKTIHAWNNINNHVLAETNLDDDDQGT